MVNRSRRGRKLTTATEGREYLGIGFYTIPEAARISGLPQYTLRRWIRTYPYSVHGRSYLHTPIISRHFPKENLPVTFLELIELLFVRLFHDEGLSLQYIRQASRRAAESFNTRYPFAVRRFDTDGKVIFSTLEETLEGRRARRFVEELGRGQIVFETVVRPFFRKLDYSRHEALRFWPMDRRGRIVLDPNRQFGKPIDDASGVPTSALYNAVINAGESVKMVAKWFEVTPAAVRAAVKYERSLALPAA